MGFLAFSFSIVEIACGNVSTTSTISASDLLKFFVSLVCAGFGFKSHLFSTGCLLTPSEMSLLITCASIEQVRRGLELMNVVQHFRHLVVFPRAELMLPCWSSSLCKISSRLRRSASVCISIAFLIDAVEMTLLSYWMLQALAVPLTILTTA